MIVFPNRWGKYYNKHVKYIYNVFHAAGYDIQLENLKFIAPGIFPVIIGNKQVIFDMGDFPGIDYNKTAPIFKRVQLEKEKNVFPLGPFLCLHHESDKDYKYLLSLRNSSIKTKYNKIYYNQRPYGNAKISRTKVYKVLGGSYKPLTQTAYWDRAILYKYNLFIPGASMYTLDRAPSELMFLGKSIIHPKIDIYFPYFKKMQPGVHYNLYEDLYSFDNLKDTGAEAKKFMQLAEPKNLTRWFYDSI